MYKYFEYQYVTLQKRKERGEDILLGFMSYVDSNFPKLAKTAHDWAYYSWNTRTESPVHPFFFKNAYRKGFKFGGPGMQTKNSWRIKDPHGFWVEINLENLYQLTDNVTIQEHELQEEYIWGRKGSNNWLIRKDSEQDFEMQAQLDTKKKNVTLEQLKPGDSVSLPNAPNLIYLGKYFDFTDYYNSEEMNKHHVFVNKNSILLNRRSAKIFTYKSGEKELTPEECLERVKSAKCYRGLFGLDFTKALLTSFNHTHVFEYPRCLVIEENNEYYFGYQSYPSIFKGILHTRGLIKIEAPVNDIIIPPVYSSPKVGEKRFDMTNIKMYSATFDFETN